MGWWGVDLDGVLAEFHGWLPDNGIGAPVPRMVKLVKHWVLQENRDIRIFTARVCVRPDKYSDVSKSAATQAFADDQEDKIKAWCLQHLGFVLPITCMKDFECERLYDDRAIQVVCNQGRLIA